METVLERDRAAAYISSRISWAAIFAGAILSVGLWLLLHVMGLAAGLTAIDPQSPSSLRSAGIGTGVWSIIASLIALFAGGVLAGHIAGPVDRLGGALHGAVLWALNTLGSLVLIAVTAGMLAQGVARVGSSAMIAAGGMDNLTGSADPMSKLGIDEKDLLAPVNQKLQAQGKAAVTAEQLRASVQSAAKTAMQQGRFDREILITALQRNTELSRADVEDLAGQLEQRYERVRDQAQTSALQAAESTGKGLWWLFGALLLGLGAAVGGAVLGVSPTQRRAVDRVREVLLREPPPLGTTAHAHT